MICPTCNGHGRVTTWRPSQFHEHDYNGSPETGSWSTRTCPQCNSTGHAPDETLSRFELIVAVAILIAIACCIMR